MARQQTAHYGGRGGYSVVLYPPIKQTTGHSFAFVPELHRHICGFCKFRLPQSVIWVTGWFVRAERNSAAISTTVRPGLESVRAIQGRRFHRRENRPLPTGFPGMCCTSRAGTFFFYAPGALAGTTVLRACSPPGNLKIFALCLLVLDDKQQSMVRRCRAGCAHVAGLAFWLSGVCE